MQDFRKLRAWQSAHQLGLDIYRITASFPSDERFGLTSQMRRSAVSVSSNIAEGCGRGTNADLARFVQIAIGSCSELESQLLFAHDLGFLDADSHALIEAQVIDVRRMLIALLPRLRAGEASSIPAQNPKARTQNS